MNAGSSSFCLQADITRKFYQILSNNNVIKFSLNPLTPNNHYSGRTAPLSSKVAFYIFIQQI